MPPRAVAAPIAATWSTLQVGLREHRVTCIGVDVRVPWRRELDRSAMKRLGHRKWQLALCRPFALLRWQTGLHHRPLRRPSLLRPAAAPAARRRRLGLAVDVGDCAARAGTGGRHFCRERERSAEDAVVLIERVCAVVAAVHNHMPIDHRERVAASLQRKGAAPIQLAPRAMFRSERMQDPSVGDNRGSPCPRKWIGGKTVRGNGRKRETDRESGADRERQLLVRRAGCVYQGRETHPVRPR